MRLLWQGGEQTCRGAHYDVEHARIYTLPEQPVELAIAAAKPKAAELAGGLGDALVTDAKEEAPGHHRGRGCRSLRDDRRVDPDRQACHAGSEP
jgi:alkanesulfonate monooxygenase SsuD/methylene tetrahydromethanopterin reductase-like flavin-dependent oxidoreductase (luciferase family)